MEYTQQWPSLHEAILLVEELAVSMTLGGGGVLVERWAECSGWVSLLEHMSLGELQKEHQTMFIGDHLPTEHEFGRLAQLSTARHGSTSTLRPLSSLSCLLM